LRLEVVIASGVIAVTCGAVSASMATMSASRALAQSRPPRRGEAGAARSLSWTHVTTTGPAISMSSSDVTTDLSNDPAADDETDSGVATGHADLEH
jgi:hypothetical protein